MNRGGARLAALCLASLIAVCVAGLLQVSFGSYHLPFTEAWAAVFDGAVLFDPAVWRALMDDGPLPTLSDATLVVWSVRLPRVVVGALVGSAVSLSGVMFQSVTRNELAGPSILGVSAGAGLVITLALVAMPSLYLSLPLFAAAGGLAAFGLVYAMAWSDGVSPLRLVLAGAVASVLFGSLQSAVVLFARDVATIQAAASWAAGSLVGAGWAEVRMIAPWCVICALAGFAGGRTIDAMMLGDEGAIGLGVSVEWARFTLAVVGALAAAAAVAASGLVGFVGLVVPHVVRSVVGVGARRVVLGSLALGAAAVTVADVVARLAFSPVQLPVGLVTGVAGAAFFLWLLRRRRMVFA